MDPDGDDDDEDDDSVDDDVAVVEDMDELAELYGAEAIFGAGSESDQGEPSFPRIATTRNNLTAHSQRYNVWLQFVV